MLHLLRKSSLPSTHHKLMKLEHENGNPSLVLQVFMNGLVNRTLNRIGMNREGVATI